MHLAANIAYKHTKAKQSRSYTYERLHHSSTSLVSIENYWSVCFNSEKVLIGRNIHQVTW